MSDSQTIPIAIPFPDAAGYQLILNTNGVQLHLTPGEADLWISGTSTFKRPPAPSVEQVGGQVKIHQEYMRSELTNMFRTVGDSPVLNLKLGTQYSYSMEFFVLGDPFSADLGGLPIKALRIGSGLGSGKLAFSAPHPDTMETLLLEAQGSQLELSQLGNAHARHITLDSKGTTFRLDWGETLEQDCLLELKVASSPTTLKLGATIALKIESQSGQFDPEGNRQLQLDPALVAHQGGYWSQAAIEGSRPTLTLRIPPVCSLAVHLV